jgi:amino-acid N-acetyltransferase
MAIRHARVSDAAAICELVNQYAERGRMLHRSLESVYDALREFLVAENADGKIIACAAMEIFWADLAELKSLAVAPECCGRGIGTRLVEAAISDARGLGISKLFALTYEKPFFERLGFKAIDKDALPEKVWRECIACPKLESCDETAMMLELGGEKDAP